MQQLASSTKFDAGAMEDRRAASYTDDTEDRAALEERCARLEQMVSELLLKNQELRLLAASLQPE